MQEALRSRSWYGLLVQHVGLKRHVLERHLQGFPSYSMKSLVEMSPRPAEVKTRRFATHRLLAMLVMIVRQHVLCLDRHPWLAEAPARSATPATQSVAVDVKLSAGVRVLWCQMAWISQSPVATAHPVCASVGL